MDGVRRWAGLALTAALSVHLGFRVSEAGAWDAAAWGLACWVGCGACLWAVAAVVSWRVDADAGAESVAGPMIAGTIGPPATPIDRRHAA